MKRPEKYILIVIAAALSIAAGIVIFRNTSLEERPTIPFNSIVWKINKRERYRMIDDILEREILLQKRKKEVIQLLGPDYTSYGNDAIKYNLHQPDSGFSLDHWVLVIKFNDSLKVDRVYKANI